MQSDFGHNILWEAPQQLARDIVALLKTGTPDPTFYRIATDGPKWQIVSDPAK